MGMRYSIAILLCAAGCNPDIIDHSRQDAAVGGPDATTAVDSGTASDAGFEDKDGAVQECQISVSGPFEFGTIGEAQQTQSQTLTNIGLADCEILSASIADPLVFEITGPSPVGILGPGSSVQVQVQTAAQLGHLETELVVTLTDSRDGPELRVPISALRQGDELASTETITFRISNTTGQDRWVDTMGWSCTPFALGIPLDIEFQCGCECPPPPDPQVSQLQRVPAGGQVDIVWDGRTAVTWMQRIECGPNDQMQELYMARQPAPAGSYTVSLGVEASLPTHCNAGTDTADCSPENGGGSGGTGGIADRCPSTDTVGGSFVLVPGQSQVVPLTITN